MDVWSIAVGNLENRKPVEPEWLTKLTRTWKPVEPIKDGLKKCNRCGEWLELDRYRIRDRESGLLRSQCKTCDAELESLRSRRRREKQRARHKQS